MIRLFFWLLLSVVSLDWKSHCADLYTASVLPIEDVELSFPIDGVLSQLIVKEGDRVQIGDTLLALDQKLQALESERRNLLWKDESKLKTQQQMDKILKQSLDDSRSLFETSISVSKDELMQQEVRYLTSQGTIESLLQAKDREAIEYKISAEVLRQHTLYAPISGIISEIKVDRGEWVKAGHPVIRIVNSRECLLELNIPIGDLNLISVGTILYLNNQSSAASLPKTARAIFISPTADRGSGLVLIKAVLDNADLSIKPGSTVSVGIK